ncbi:hypothetical protein [Nocardia sp. NPDC057353]
MQSVIGGHAQDAEADAMATDTIGFSRESWTDKRRALLTPPAHSELIS